MYVDDLITESMNENQFKIKRECFKENFKVTKSGSLFQLREIKFNRGED